MTGIEHSVNTIIQLLFLLCYPCLPHKCCLFLFQARGLDFWWERMRLGWWWERLMRLLENRKCILNLIVVCRQSILRPLLGQGALTRLLLGSKEEPSRHPCSCSDSPSAWLLSSAQAPCLSLSSFFPYDSFVTQSVVDLTQALPRYVSLLPPGIVYHLWELGISLPTVLRYPFFKFSLTTSIWACHLFLTARWRIQ